jgi:ferredoxin-NADP reductase
VASGAELLSLARWKGVRMMHAVSATLERAQDQIAVTVHQISREADGVVTVTVRSADGTDLPPWRAGAHVDLCLPGFVRQYSLCGDPRDRSAYRLGVLREAAGRGGSRYVHDRLSPGDQVAIRGPRNRFPLADARRYLFIAGGIGITPLLPMLAELAARDAEWTLVYGGRTRSSMAFLGELARYGSRVRVCPQDETGLLDLGRVLDVPDGTAVYCCGPEPLITATERGCALRSGVRLHLERFTASGLVSEAPATPFEVRCADSGTTVRVGADQTILEALIEAGIDVNYDCQEGTCGTCELDVIDGEVDHLDSVYTAEQHREMNVIFPCVSRARCPRLTLDV